MAKRLEWDNCAPRDRLHFKHSFNLSTTPISPELLMSGKIDCSHLPAARLRSSGSASMSPGTGSAGDSGGEVRVLNDPLSLLQNIPEPAFKGEQPSSPQLLLLAQKSPDSARLGSTELSHCVSLHTFNKPRPDRDQQHDLFGHWPIREQRALTPGAHPG